MRKIFQICLLVFIGLYLTSCGIRFGRKTSTKIKKFLIAKGGQWDVEQIDYYYSGLGNQLLGETDYGLVGTFHFEKNESNALPTTSRKGKWYPNNGSSVDFLYQVFSDDVHEEIGLLSIYVYENGQWVIDENYEVFEGYSKESMHMESQEGRNDTIIKHTLFLTNKG